MSPSHPSKADRRRTCAFTDAFEAEEALALDGRGLVVRAEGRRDGRHEGHHNLVAEHAASIGHVNVEVVRVAHASEDGRWRGRGRARSRRRFCTRLQTRGPRLGCRCSDGRFRSSCRTVGHRTC
eukprot:5359137-Pleurochrysis_carterae.AAC.2